MNDDMTVGPRGCSGLNRHGQPCKAPVLPGTTPPVCRRHSMSDAAWKESARKGGRERWNVKRAKDLRGQIEDQVIGQRVLETVSRMLDAKIPGSAEPNIESVTYALLVLVENFKLGTREEIVELLGEVRPKLARDPAAYRMLDVEAARQRLVRALEEGRIDREDLPAGVL
jgi:hypothetical protein